MKVAVVTGGGSGIGAETARRLSSDGYHVAIMGRRSAALEQVAAAIGGSRVMPVRCDVTVAQDVIRAFSQVRAAWDHIDLLVNNAGSALDRRILDTTAADWDRVMGTNLDGTFFCTRECLRGMVARESGHVIVVASQAAGWPGFGEFAYGIAKTAQVKLVLHLLDEFRVLGKIAGKAGRPAPALHAHAVCPGPVDTPMWDELGRSRDGRTALLAPGDCADLISSLAANPQANFADFADRPYRVGEIASVLQPHPNILRVWKEN